MQLVLFLCEVKINAAADTLDPPRAPLAQYLSYAHDSGVSGNKNIEVAREAVHKRRELKKLLHELFGIGAALKINGELKTAEVCFVAHVVYLFDLAGLYKLGHLIDDGLGGRGIRYLVYLDYILLRKVTPSGAHLEASAPGVVDSFHLGAVVHYLAAGRKIGSRHGEKNIALWILKIFYCCATGLFKVKAAYLACHADGDAGIA